MATPHGHIEKLDVLEAQRDQIDHLRAELLVTQQLNAELLDALELFTGGVEAALQRAKKAMVDAAGPTEDDKAALLEALQAVVRADALEAAQDIACAAIAIAIARGERE
jgi:hypothetical protein